MIDLEAHFASLDAEERALLGDVVARMRAGLVDPNAPGYFGPFNQAPSALAIAAETIVAAFNPQLAVKSHAEWPVSVEAELVRAFGARFGFAEVEGTFTSGGAEANLTAVLAALAHAYPEAATRGVRALTSDPVMFVSTEAHPTLLRAARVVGLGSDAVREIPCDSKSRMKTSALRDAIAREQGRPFLVVATVGTTSAGAIDPLPEIAGIAERAGAWLHVDAAYGGLAALVPETASALDGIARADSITFDPHKSLSIPMNAGMYLSRRLGMLAKLFQDRAGYMPRDASGDPYARSLAWSRRFQGLKVHVALAARGFDGIAAMLRRRMAMADHLRVGLCARGWKLANETVLPVVCFTHDEMGSLDRCARSVISSGSWVSVVKLSSGVRALRACINNEATREEHLDALLDALDRARTHSITCKPPKPV